MKMNEPNIWKEIEIFFTEMLTTLLNRVDSLVTQHGHSVVLALLTLALGWLVAAFAGKVLAKLLRALGFDVIWDRSGLRNHLLRAEIHSAPSRIVGTALYYVLLWTTVMLCFDRLRFEAAANIMRQIVSWIPQFLIAVVLIGLGMFLGRWLGRLTSRAARVAGLPFYRALGQVVRGLILLATLVVALDQAGLASRSAILTGLAVTATIGLLVGLGLAVFARDVVSNILARHVVAREFRLGEVIEFGNVQGQLLSLGVTGARIRGDEKEYLIPHRRLVGEVIARSALR